MLTSTSVCSIYVLAGSASPQLHGGLRAAIHFGLQPGRTARREASCACGSGRRAGRRRGATRRGLHHSPSPPLSLNTAARTCPLAFLARDRCSAAAKPTRAAVVCASSLAPPVALLSACGVSVTYARASLAPPCRVWAAPLACLCRAALLLLHEKPI